MGENIVKLILAMFWLFTIPANVCVAVEYHKNGKYYRCGLNTMLAIIGLMYITGIMFGL